MSERIEFHRLVATGLTEAIAWYEERATGLGTQFRTAVDARFDDLMESPAPTLFPRAFDDLDFRFVLIPRFPCLILFRVRDDTISVLGVFHTASNPAKCRRRDIQG